jgi:hypothetical protein
VARTGLIKWRLTNSLKHHVDHSVLFPEFPAGRRLPGACVVNEEAPARERIVFGRQRDAGDHDLTILSVDDVRQFV